MMINVDGNSYDDDDECHENVMVTVMRMNVMRILMVTVMMII